MSFPRAAGRWVAGEVVSGLAAPFTNAALDGSAIAANGLDAAYSTFRGGRGLRRTIVAGEWWHGGSDRANALAQIGTELLTFQNDLTQTATKADAIWIAADVAPTLAEWRNFVARMAASVIAPYVTEWSVFMTWQSRLERLREAARARGIPLESPEPQDLPKTVWQRGRDGTGGGLDPWIALGKTAIFGTLAVTGIVGFYSISKSVHNAIRDKVRKAT